MLDASGRPPVPAGLEEAALASGSKRGGSGRPSAAKKQRISGASGGPWTGALGRSFGSEMQCQEMFTDLFHLHTHHARNVSQQHTLKSS